MDEVVVNGRRYVPAPTYGITEGAERIARERADQLQLKDWTPEHDDSHINGELRDAAIAYAMSCDDRAGDNARDIWPWDDEWWKPDRDAIRTLEKAGALIAAEIDRLLRKRLADLDSRLHEMGL